MGTPEGVPDRGAVAIAFTTVATVVAGLKVAASTFGNKVSAAIAELQAIRSGGEAGPDAAGPSVGTTPLTIDTFTFTDPGVSGRVHVWATSVLTKSVATDRFQMQLLADSVEFARWTERSGANDTAVTAMVSGSAGFTTGTSPVIDVVVTRISGTGTATPGGGALTILHHIFVPAP